MEEGLKDWKTPEDQGVYCEIVSPRNARKSDAVVGKSHPHDCLAQHELKKDIPVWMPIKPQHWTKNSRKVRNVENRKSSLPQGRYTMLATTIWSVLKTYM